MYSFLINILVSLSINSFGYAYSPSAWGILKKSLINTPSRIGSYCSSNKRFDNIFHVTKISNVKSILKSGKILPRSHLNYFPEQLFKDCDCNPDVVYASFKNQQAREGKSIFKFPSSCFEDYLESEEKAEKIYITGFYNLGNFDPTYSSTIQDVNKFCSFITLPGHELVIPCSLSLGSGFFLVSHPNDREKIIGLLDEYDYQYTLEQDKESEQITFCIN